MMNSERGVLHSERVMVNMVHLEKLRCGGALLDITRLSFIERPERRQTGHVIIL